jgi:membrane glycosyltransferase
VATELDSSPCSSTAVESSHLRVRMNPAASRAARRVANYLRAVGLSDRARVRDLSQRIALSVNADNADQHAERAVAEAQSRFESWRAELLAALPEGVNPLWLRAFIAARPEHFLGDLARARRAASQFGDPLAGTGPRTAAFRPQAFQRARVPSSLLGLLPPLLMTWAASTALWRAVSADGWSWIEATWTGLFVFLFFQAAAGLSTATIGFVSRLRRKARGASGTSDAGAQPAAELPRTALLVPIYHESAEDVFAALAGMRESLAALPEGRSFEVFVLSDSRNPEVCADEERAFRRVAAASDSIPIYYHRRAHNVRQKAGNLAEFFERWGLRYTYAITLDADSVMNGQTLVELVRRMEQNPKLALLQAPLAVHRAETLFARALSFSSSLCGPLFTQGLSVWSGPHANYYGHNAALRVSAFLDCCALPKLNGEPPFGGHILSHDFVEAALLCRSGWEVRIAHDLEGGSYEELPPTLNEFVARDHRWCQGNMQHLRIAMMQGFKSMSRIHMLLGAFAYLSAPGWLVFMALGLASWLTDGVAFERVSPWVGAATLTVLAGPWLLSMLDGLRSSARRRRHGGAFGVVASSLLGLVLGSVLAPLLMLHHTRIVLSIFCGRAIGWGSQQRKASGNFVKTLRMEWPATVLGLGLGLWTFAADTGLELWLAPLWVPWALSIPLNMLASSATLGALARRLGLLAVPTELEPEPLLSRIEELRILTRSDASARFRDLVLDPVLVATHIAKLKGTLPAAAPKRLAELRTRALREGPASLSAAEWRAVAEDAESMQVLHREAWRRWPVEAWDLGREEPQLPPEPRAATATDTATAEDAADGLETVPDSMDDGMELADEQEKPTAAAFSSLHGSAIHETSAHTSTGPVSPHAANPQSASAQPASRRNR